MSHLDFNSSHVTLYPAADLARLETPKDYFLVEPGMLPRGGKFILGGGPKIGKTWVVLSMLRAMLEGSELFSHKDWQVRKVRTLLIEREIGPLSLAGRFRDALGLDLLDANPNVLQVISKPRGFSLSNPSAVKWLAKLLATEGIDLLLLDPINKLWHGDENSSSEMLRLVDSLEEIQDGKIGLVMSHHFGKPVRGQGADSWDSLDSSNFRGSSRLADDADALFTMQRVRGRLVPSWESWSSRARLMLRNAEAPEDFLLHFNEANDRRAVWHEVPERVDRTPPRVAQAQGRVTEFPRVG